jgi:GAF domain-containing protein
MPVHAGERVWGVLRLEAPLEDDDLLLLETIAVHVGSALHRAELQRTIDGLKNARPEAESPLGTAGLDAPRS